MIRSYELKLTRAAEHISNIEKCFSAWSGEGYRVFEQTNSKGRSELVAEMLKALPYEIPLAIGDAIHCLRDSLDHIVFDLSISRSGPLTEEQERGIQFPIGSTTVEIGDGRIRFMSINAQQAIISLLPNPTRNQFRQHPLFLLNKMNNRDKHRTIPVIVASSYVGRLAINASDGSDYFHIIGPARPVVGEGPITFLEFARRPHVKADITFATQIEFDEGTYVSGNPVIHWLRSIEKHIRNVVLPALESFL